MVADLFNHLSDLELVCWFLVVVLVQIAGGRTIGKAWRRFRERGEDWLSEGNGRPVR